MAFPNELVVGLPAFLIASILLSAFNFLLYSSNIVDRRPSPCNFTSNWSEDFCRNRAKSLGFMFRSREELEGLSWVPLPLLLLLLLLAEFGTIGGSTGAARRMFFGGGLRWKGREERRRKGNGFSIINRFVTFYRFCVSCRVGRGRYK